MNFIRKHSNIIAFISMGFLIGMIQQELDMSFTKGIVFAIAFGLYTGSIIAVAKKEALK